MSFENTKQTIFTGTELDYEEIVEIPEGYEKAELKDFEDGTLITGRPEMASVTSFTFDDDGEEKTVNRFKLFIFKDDEKIYVEINVNLKNDGDLHKNIRKGSVLFDFITSILELENTGSVGRSNILRNVNLAEYREFVNILKNWKTEILNSFLRPYDEKKLSNAFCENINGKIRQHLTLSRGIANFTRFRKRILLALNPRIFYSVTNVLYSDKREGRKRGKYRKITE